MRKVSDIFRSQIFSVNEKNIYKNTYRLHHVEVLDEIFFILVQLKDGLPYKQVIVDKRVSA